MTKLAPISESIWDMKYRLKSPDGVPLDQTIDETWRRVAQALAANERTPDLWEERFYHAMAGFRFLPAGRILAGAGAGRKVTLFNCFVMGRIPDDMGGIFEHLREGALTLQQGGGIGYDFSTLRPRGAPVGGVGADASGPLSFMDVWDAMCATIMSAGARRGAMMATLRCDHPDIEDFVTAKQTAGRLTNFNLSVLVTDAFMQAVEGDLPWHLTFDGKTHRTLQARDLWERIMRSTYDYAEPGVIFIDRINKTNNLWYCEDIYATNPCAEQPLPPYGACLLGSVNLATLVRRPFAADADLDLAELEELVAVAVRMMDNVVDISNFPLDAQRREAHGKRRIGLGVTGLADALIFCGLRYGSAAAVATTRRWMAAIRFAAYRASIELAKEKGVFPLFDAEKYLAGPTVQGLEPELREEISRHGIRNALLTSIAPTGTISLFADNVSSGIEPVFAFSYTRKVRQPDGTRLEEEVSDPAWRLWRHLHGADQSLPEAFVDAQTLNPADHIVMQAAVQDYIDSSISKTINCPPELSFADFQDIYRQAYLSGCKGCTTYRPSDVRGAVLAVKPAEESPSAELLAPAGPPLPRPEALAGQTYKIKWPDSDHAMYITINDTVVEGRRRPFEIFINSKNMEHYAWTVALTRMISAVFRRGGEINFVSEELKAVFDPRGGQWMGGRYVPSLLAAIGEVIERHMAGLERPTAPEPVAVGRSCPKCGSPGLQKQEGCETCLNCGYSKCS